MTEFLGDIAFMLEVLILGLGLIVLHFNKKEKSHFLKWSGRLMSTFGVLGMVCTGYFYMKYLVAGDFDQAHHMRNRSHSMMGMMRDNGSENHIMMNRQMQKNMRQHMISTVNQCMDEAQGDTLDAKSKLMVGTCFQNNMDKN